MLILKKEDIKRLFTMKEAIETSKEALRMHSAGNTTVPLRINIDIPEENGHSLFMPAYNDELTTIGIKIVSIFPKNPDRNLPAVRAQMLLLDGKTGEVLAMMDGTYLTQLRTGALQGAATDILAKQNAKTAVLFGTGGQAQTQLEALLHVRDLQEISVCGKNPEHTQLFVLAMQKEFAQFSTKIIAAKDVEETVRHADIITAITTSHQPVFDGFLVKKGTHINGMGAYTADMQELPETLIQRAEKIFFDTKEGVLAEAGDILIPLKIGSVTEAHFDGELGQVILGNVKGRESEEEITLFKSVGTAALDLATACKIYQKALDFNIGNSVDI